MMSLHTSVNRVFLHVTDCVQNKRRPSCCSIKCQLRGQRVDESERVGGYIFVFSISSEVVVVFVNVGLFFFFNASFLGVKRLWP